MGSTNLEGAVGPRTQSADPCRIDVSLIVPTRNEAPNVESLLKRIDSVGFEGTIEVVFVDDSDDDTPRLAAAAQQHYDFGISVIHRPAGWRQGGLGSAVVSGLVAANGEFACVLDGDLQHPPERIPELHRRAVTDGVDLVIGSRYIGDGSAEGLSKTRVAISRFAGLIARATLRKGCCGITDPMSGFFLVRMDKLVLARVKGDGFKILLEIVVTHPELQRAEVPYRFEERYAGETKASAVEGLRFIKALAALRIRPSRKTYYYDPEQRRSTVRPSSISQRWRSNITRRTSH